MKARALPRTIAAGAAVALTAGGTLVAAGVLSVAGALGAPGVAHAQVAIDPDGTYQLVSRHSGKAIRAGSTADPGAVVQWEPQDAPDQQFQLVPAADGTYRIRSRDTGLVLDLWEWNGGNGAEIRMYDDLGGANQRFQLRDGPEGSVGFVNEFSGKALDVWERSTEDGGRISQFDDTGGANQQWDVVPVDGGTTPRCTGGGGGAGPVDPLPVGGDLAAHDPTMVDTPSGYVVYSTHNGVETRTSPDRTQFTRAAAAIPGGATWAGAYNGGDPDFIWAPDVSFHDGTYWLYYSVSTFGSNRSAIGLATSDTGQPGSFVDQGMVYDSAPGDDYNAIDPSLLVDSGGDWWLVFGSFWSGIKMIQLDPATGMQSPTNQTRYALASTPSTQIEGPHLVQRCGFYYLFVAWGVCCQGLDSTYEIRVGRSQSPTGPYLDRSGLDMMAGGGTEVLATHGQVVGPGAPAVLADTDGDILVYHYYDGAAGGATRLGLNHLTWGDDGWPALAAA